MIKDSESSGLLLIDKPAGLSSHAVVQRVKHLLHVHKVGHTGTLDPAATGLLVLCVNRATREAGALTGLNKAYQALIELGLATDTGDRDGTITAQVAVPPLTRETVAAALAKFQGEMEQEVPIYSAVKVAGQPLYRRARRGEKIVPPRRWVTLEMLELLDFSSPRLSLTVTCSKGTYIRSLAVDIGKALGLPAHLAALRRLRVGPFELSQALSLQDLERAGCHWRKLLYKPDAPC